MASPSPKPVPLRSLWPDGWPPEPFERVAPGVGVHARSLVDHVQADDVAFECSAYEDLGVVGDGVEGVGDQVVEDLLDRTGDRHGPQVCGAVAGQSHGLVGGDGRPGVDPFGDRGGQVDWDRFDRGGVAAGEDEERVDEPAEPVRLGDGGVELRAGRLGDVGGEGLEPEAQRGERCAQLVGGVGDESALGLDELREVFGGGVERLGEVAELRWAVVGVDADREVPGREASRGALESADRAGDTVGEHHPDGGDEREDDGRQEPEAQPRGADPGVHRRGGVGDPDGAVDAAA